MSNEEWDRFVEGFILGRKMSGATREQLEGELRELATMLMQSRLLKLIDDGDFDDIITELNQPA